MNDLTWADLAGLAATFEDRASRVEALAAELATRAAAATWQGPAAERFRLTMTERQQILRAAAERLREAAHHARLLIAAATP